MSNTSRIIVIGLDGSPHTLIKKYVDNRIMPYLKGIVEKGCLYQMDTVLPDVSAVAWSSFMTGKNPAKTGIYGFFDMIPGTYDNVYTNYSHLKESTLWNIINKETRKPSIIINMPCTYPVKPMNGVMVSGFISSDLDKAVYPQNLLPLLKQAQYKIDPDPEKILKSTDFLMSELNLILKQRKDLVDFLWDKLDWKLFTCVITGTDRLQHFIMDAFENNDHNYREQFENYYRNVDLFIGSILNKINENDVVILLSDHGFEVTDYEVYLNVLFKKLGWLENIGYQEHGFKEISDKTKVFCLDPGRIYINRKPRYPYGSDLTEEEYNKCLIEIQAELENLKSPEGKKVVRYIYRKEEIYSGPFIKYAPDLVVVPEKGFTFKGAAKLEDVFIKPSMHYGSHNYDDAFLACNKKLLPHKKPNIMDITPTILSLLNVDIDQYKFDGCLIEVLK
ncbi:MAG: alkaline phosphatase family protein [Vampirovibrionia bacterium]